MRQGVMSIVSAAKDLPQMSARPPPNGQRFDTEAQVDNFPRLLGSFPRVLPEKRPQHAVRLVSVDSFPPDLDSIVGMGSYAGVYNVKGNPQKVMKIFNSDDWAEVEKESLFAQALKSKVPDHSVDCYGIGNTENLVSAHSKGKHFAVFERAEGLTLREAGHRNHLPDGLQRVEQALEVLDQLLTIMIAMMTPDEKDLVHFHLDLKPENILVAQDGNGGNIKLILVDYGLVASHPKDVQGAKDGAGQMFRWLGWELLWVLSSEQFKLDTAGARENPWEQLPEGFLPFFKPSELRPSAYRTEKLSPSLIQTAMTDAYFEEVMSPAFRCQWRNKAEAKANIGKLIGELFFGVAQASDHTAFEPDFIAIQTAVKSLKALVS